MKNGKAFKVRDGDFKKSSYSRIITWCVKVAIKPEGVAVRDSKDASKTTLFFTNDEWKAFANGVKAGEFNI